MLQRVSTLPLRGSKPAPAAASVKPSFPVREEIVKPTSVNDLPFNSPSPPVQPTAAWQLC
jgi:hypothetical protein